MSKFKVGDKVITTTGSGAGENYIGQRLTIRRIDVDDDYCTFNEVDYGLFMDRFELVTEENMFKIGDNIRRTDLFQGHITRGKLYTVLDGYKYRCDNGRELDIYSDQWELVSVLEDLVKTANEGFRAVRTLLRKHKDKVEMNGQSTQSKWGAFHHDRTIGSNAAYSCHSRMIKIKETKKEFSLKRIQDWDVGVGNGSIRIGCKEFKIKELTSSLSSATKPIPYLKTYYSPTICRDGVIYDGVTLTWENADKLLAALKEYAS